MDTDAADAHVTGADMTEANAMDTDMMDSDANSMAADAIDPDTMDVNAMDTYATDLDADAIDPYALDSDMDADAMDSDGSVDANVTGLDAVDLDTMDLDTADLDASTTADSSTVIIKRFPFGHAGAPIVRPHQALVPNGSSSTATGDSVWSPFRSQLDWEVARWAKTCRVTSSAVTELLAIPGVGPPLIPHVAALMHRPRLLTALDFHTEP